MATIVADERNLEHPNIHGLHTATNTYKITAP
jgi:hypothetical protein